MRKLLLSSLMCLMVSCATERVVNIPIADFPLKPKIVEYTRKPIIDSTEKDFKVSDEFVKNSIALKQYSDRIDAWKLRNKVNK